MGRCSLSHPSFRPRSSGSSASSWSFSASGRSSPRPVSGMRWSTGASWHDWSSPRSSGFASWPRCSCSSCSGSRRRCWPRSSAFRISRGGSGYPRRSPRSWPSGRLTRRSSRRILGSGRSPWWRLRRASPASRWRLRGCSWGRRLPLLSAGSGYAGPAAFATPTTAFSLPVW